MRAIVTLALYGAVLTLATPTQRDRIRDVSPMELLATNASNLSLTLNDTNLDVAARFNSDKLMSRFHEIVTSQIDVVRKPYEGVERGLPQVRDLKISIYDSSLTFNIILVWYGSYLDAAHDYPVREKNSQRDGWYEISRYVSFGLGQSRNTNVKDLAPLFRRADEPPIWRFSHQSVPVSYLDIVRILESERVPLRVAGHEIRMPDKKLWFPYSRLDPKPYWTITTREFPSRTLYIDMQANNGHGAVVRPFTQPLGRIHNESIIIQ